jgi:hypothetical protein
MTTDNPPPGAPSDPPRRIGSRAASHLQGKHEEAISNLPLMIVGNPDPHPKGAREKAIYKRLTDDDDIKSLDVGVAMKALEEVRKRAEAWRNGTAAALGLVFATLAVKNPGETVGAYGGWNRDLLAGLIGLSVVCGLASLFWFLRAANGPSWLDTRIKDFARARGALRFLGRAEAASKNLRFGQILFFLALALFGGAVTLTWYFEPA